MTSDVRSVPDYHHVDPREAAGLAHVWLLIVDDHPIVLTGVKLLLPGHRRGGVGVGSVRGGERLQPTLFLPA